jgi:hypothetical protein
MHSLTDWKTRFPKIPQRGPFWCIPASIENMLRYAGFTAISQEDLVLGYCRRFGEDSISAVVSYPPLRTAPVSIRNLGGVAIINLARRCCFNHGNFETFAEPATQNVAFKQAKFSLKFTGNIQTKRDYFQKMTDAVMADCPVLISVNNGDGTFHIQSVIEVEADKFKAYDPALDRIEEYNLANCVFSHDVLVLKKEN